MDNKAKIISFSSGKGGVGKTCTAVNLSILLAQQGFKVCLFDADANLANVNIMLKLFPENTVEHVISGKKTLNEIILHKAGINIIPGSSGLEDFISLVPEQQKRLQATMLELKSNYDYLLIDNSAGISENVLSYVKFSDSGIIVITGEPTSLTDAFALVRVLKKRGNTRKLNIIVNNVVSKSYAEKIYLRFAAAVKKHIGCDLNYLGWIVSDKLIPQSIREQNPVVIQHPDSPAALNLKDVSRELVSLLKEESIESSTMSTQASSQFSQDQDSKMEPDLHRQDVSSHIETTIIGKPGSGESEQESSLSVHQQQESIEPAQDSSLSVTQLKSELLQKISNGEYKSGELKDIVDSINNAYLTRAADDAVNLSAIIANAVTMEHISKHTMKHLIITLLGLYQDQYGNALEITELVPGVTPEAPKPEPVQNIPSQESVDRLIQIMEQVLNLVSNSPETNHLDKPKLVPPASKSRVELNTQELADTIRYASLVGNLKS